LRGTFDTVAHAAYRLLAGDSVQAREQLLHLARARGTRPVRLLPTSSGESRTQAVSPASNQAWLAMALGNRGEALSALEQLPNDVYAWAAPA
jgi:predicted dinucleotide-binding enzyme